MKETDRTNLIKISELAEAAGVSVSTIHYYVQEGLLTPPIKTSRNMAYYDSRSIQEIKSIRRLQEQRFLPLSAIKLIIKAEQEGQAADHITEMGSLFKNIFQPLDLENEIRKVTLEELVTLSGLSDATLKTLENMGLMAPVPTEQGPMYDEIDIRIAQILKNMTDCGLKPEDLDIYRQYVEIIRLEAQTMHAVFHRLPDHDKIPITKLFQAAIELKKYLAIKITRQEAQHMLQEGFNRGEKSKNE